MKTGLDPNSANVRLSERDQLIRKDLCRRIYINEDY